MALQKLDIVLAGAGGVMLGSFLHMTTLSHYTRQGYDFVGLMTLAFLAYAMILLALRSIQRTRLAWLIALAVICRMVLWVDMPTLSTDVWRYLWDGRLTNAGINPYTYRVDDPTLDELRTPLSERVEHTHMSTPYPPAAQLTFAATVAIQPEQPRAMQVVFTLFDLGSGVLIILLLRALGRPEKWVVLYLLNPLIIVEFAHGAHVDSLMTFFILLALLAHIQARNMQSSLALAVSVLTKYIPAILIPVFLRQWGPRYAVLFGVAVLLGFVPFLDAGPGIGTQDDGSGIFGAVRIYTNDWKTNDGFFYWLHERLIPYSDDPIQTTRFVTNAMLLLVGGWILLHTPAHAEPERIILNAAVLISVYLLLVAAMFPWYLTWLIALLPLLPFHRKLSPLLLVIAWLYFSWAVQWSYLIYLNPDDPREDLWIRYVEYGPLFAILGAALLSWLYEQGRQLAGGVRPAVFLPQK
jgi:alpha-1,6-mannosyltransferase